MSSENAVPGWTVHRAGDRYPGGDPAAGIRTRHAFSFGPHYDPDNLRFGALIAVNEERLAPGAGFAEHPHSHTEIVTWVTEGTLAHRDSAGHTTEVRPGDLQHLSAASGVRHEEREGAGKGGDRDLVFVQMWLAPREPGGDPGYTVLHSLPTPIARYELPAAGAVLHVHRPAGPGAEVPLPAAPFVYAHVVRGTLRLAGDELGPGDAVRARGGAPALTALDAAEVLVWEMAG
ncbi:pirin family protein [Streptomyces lichenis]|uniref:Pirin family protein n=1 Tax=Streptomyces lichenis TaxID=2306967 RepID=A0ABT0I6S9_9ACTN|nr:pirin family protein [Streptomyces lichenis]MCK8677012.1 pirin family protein [Streptomyces lichenis]